jgi:hypothetical protein
MPYGTFAGDEPWGAGGSAAQEDDIDEERPAAYIERKEAGFVKPRFRMVAGGAPIIEEDDYPAVAYASDSDDENWFDSARAFEARLEARIEDGHWSSKAPFLAAVDNGKAESKPGKSKGKRNSKLKAADGAQTRRPGLKKLTEKQIAQDLPPTPKGCEWRRSDEGLNLWRYWTEWDADKNQRIKKSRYAGHLSDDAWRIMKEYDHEAFISIVGERLRRYSGR